MLARLDAGIVVVAVGEEEGEDLSFGCHRLPLRVVGLERQACAQEIFLRTMHLEEEMRSLM